MNWTCHKVHLRYSVHTNAETGHFPAPESLGAACRHAALPLVLRRITLGHPGRPDRPGARLPATRDLSREYKLARATVVAAFEQLKSEGYVEGKVGAGTYVSQVLPDDLLQADRPGAGKSTGPRRVGWSAYARRLQLYPEGGPRTTRAFRANQAALDVFPTTLWAQVVARRLRRASAQLLSGGEALGYRPLRQAVAAYLNASRGVKCSP